MTEKKKVKYFPRRSKKREKYVDVPGQVQNRRRTLELICHVTEKEKAWYLQ
jgi:hypothetical protein